ncbi:N-acetylmuramoyl-L-alanine amidase, partial [Myxococcota bacterium]|nr:N-acetylmuramoyl-L-alanine amidase [Myxococcota bacterium]
MSLLLSACGAGGDDELAESLSVQEAPEVTETSPLAASFVEASSRWNIPVDVLKALAYDQTGLEPATGEIEFEGQPEPWGYFALAGKELERAAALSGRTVEELRGDDLAGIDAAAALLDAYAADVGLAGAERDTVEGWAKVIERFGDLDDREMAAQRATDVLEHLARGVAVPMFDGTTFVINRYTHLDRGPDPDEDAFDTSISGLGQSGAIWRPSPNHNSRGNSRVELVVIHTCEGAYTGCVSWLRNSRAGASAHYVVKENGREISQLVDESRRAWHVAASYRPRLNSGRISSRSGQSVNTFSVGIEHGGRAAQRSWPQAQINASVALVRGITARHNIPRDRYHIVAHGRLQPENRTDPGPNWPWSSYLAAIA